MRTLGPRLTAACLLFALSMAPAWAQSQGSSVKNQPARTDATSGVSAADIAAAKAAGKVWVNLGSGVYHKGGRWYGKTKDGKFMTEEEAKKAGYKAAKREN